MSTTSDDDIETVVFDIGSHCARAGFAGDDEPLVDMNYSDHPEFQEPYLHNGFKLYNPNEFDVDVFEKTVKICYSSLSKNKEVMKTNPAFFSEHLNECQTHREKLFELMFETFEVPAMYVYPSPLLSLYSSGRGSGIVVESGNSVTQTAVVYEGFMFANSVFTENHAGAEVTKRLQNYLANNQRFDDADYVYLKEKYASCVKSSVTEVKLPDGSVHTIKAEPLSKCTEWLFDSSVMDLSLPKMVYESIMSCNIHCRKDLFCNVILSGGNTMTSDFPTQLQEHLDKTVAERHRGLRVKVVASPERSIFPWIGGSIVGSLSCFMNALLIAKQEYQESGSKIVSLKLINPDSHSI